MSNVYVVSIEVDGRQAYIFETDRLREMLGASRLIQATVGQAKGLFKDEDGLFLFQPVSGEIRVWAEATPGQRALLLERTWALKQWLNNRGIEHTCAWSLERRADLVQWAPTPEPDKARRDDSLDRPSLSRLQREVGVRASTLKGAKGGSDARPACSLFAPCEIHGHDYATEWRIGADADTQDSRRNLRGFRAAEKLNEWQRAQSDLFEQGLYKPFEAIANRIQALKGTRPQRPVQLDELSAAETGQGGDQFVAFICADGDGLGELLQQIDWNHPDLEVIAAAPWIVNRAFVEKLDRAVNLAYGEAVAEVLDEKYISAALASGSPRLPMLPQLLGGDDLWTVSTREVALPFCCAFSKAFAQRVVADPTVRAVVESTGRSIAELTISFGVVFAKAGHPAHAMIETAESLLRSAKALRKGLISGRPRPSEGCIDWHWVDSSLIQSVNEARDTGLAYSAEGGETCVLTSRPWTMSQCADVVAAARQWSGAIPRRKREQVESILRRGPVLAALAWEAWAKGLRSAERTGLQSLCTTLERTEMIDAAVPPGQPQPPIDARSPWKATAAGARSTPFIDLLSLDDVLGIADGGQS